MAVAGEVLVTQPSAHSLSGQRDADDQYRYAATCIKTQPENHMLLLFLIGAALCHTRPEPQSDSGLPTDPLHAHSERWRCTSGAEAFWR